MKFSKNQSLIIAYEYRIGNLIIYPGTYGICHGEREGNVEVTVGSIGYLMPENYLMTAEEYIKFKESQK